VIHVLDPGLPGTGRRKILFVIPEIPVIAGYIACGEIGGPFTLGCQKAIHPARGENRPMKDITFQITVFGAEIA
jgi:hypothetical protein